MKKSDVQGIVEVRLRTNFSAIFSYLVEIMESSETSLGHQESVSALVVSAAANQLQNFHTTTPANVEFLSIQEDIAFNASDDTYLHHNGNYGYYVLALKIGLTLWDIVGLVFNLFGIDFFWSGIEVNHAVYNLVFQDLVLCWGSVAIWTLTGWIWWTSPADQTPRPNTWLVMYLTFSLLPLLFHDCSWAWVAYLRHFNVTDNDQWLELDQKALTGNTARRTWMVTSAQTVVLAICLRFILYNMPLCTSDHVISIVIVMTLLVLLLPYAVSFVYYGKILVYARRLASQEAAERRHFDGSVVLDNNIGPQEVTGVIFDDTSGDEELLDPEEAPSAKQLVAGLMAMKTSFCLCLTRVAAVILLVTLNKGSTVGLAATAVIVSLLRFPTTLLISILNFRPLRNKVGLYVENLPERIEEFFEPVPEWLHAFKWCRSASDDRRSIVADESDGSSSDDTAGGSGGGGSSNASARKGRSIIPTLMGNRVSAVSPSPDNTSPAEDEPPNNGTAAAAAAEVEESKKEDGQHLPPIVS